uniref:Uncharacterized protein n=1 Tax=Oryza rufipogon TaxID=4529 RepID=A0A0E0N778_ORYRU
MTFYSSGTSAMAMWMEYMRRNDGKIVGINHTGHAILYDPATRTVHTLPAIKTPKLWAISAAVGDNLYHRDDTSP